MLKRKRKYNQDKRQNNHKKTTTDSKVDDLQVSAFTINQINKYLNYFLGEEKN